MIELLSKAFNVSDDNYGTPNIEQVADCLLEHGALAPPVKIGDTVYVISRRGEIMPVIITKIRYSDRWNEIFGSEKSHPDYPDIYIDPDNRIAAKWFKTREEAENYLKGGTE